MEETQETKSEETQETSEESSSHIFIIKVTTNKEDRALELISDKVHKKDLNVYALARPHGLRGYIFLEAADRDSAEEAAYNLPYVKGIIGKTVSYEEIKNMLEPVMEEINIEKGDIVEIIGEPFKKEKAKVVRIDKSKGEAVVTLLAAVVPIPVTVKLDNVKVIRREKEEGEEEEDNENEGSEVQKEQQQKQEEFESETPLGDAPETEEDYETQSGGLIPDDF
jgi:transcription termination/antitermination protein NusG